MINFRNKQLKSTYASHIIYRYNIVFISLACSLAVLLAQCSNKKSSSTNYSANHVSIQEPGFLKAWNASKLDAIHVVEKQYCLSKINQNNTLCVCLNNAKYRISLQDDTTYNFLDSRYRWLLTYDKAIEDDKKSKSRRIYILDVAKEGEVQQHDIIVFVLSDLKSTYYEFENYEDLAGGWRVKKSSTISDEETSLLENLWNTTDKPLQNKPEDYCGSTFIFLTKVDEKITTRVPIYTNENWFNMLIQINKKIR